MTIDFDKMQTRLVIEGLVTQVILPSDPPLDIQKGDVVGITFGGLLFEDFNVEIVDVTRTSMGRLTTVDAFKNGFSYKPFFFDFLSDKGFAEDEAVLKVDFQLVGE